jgi:hypothetical protein
MPTKIPRKPPCNTKPSRRFLPVANVVDMKKKETELKQKIAELEKKIADKKIIRKQQLERKMLMRWVKEDRAERWVMENSLNPMNRQNNEEMEGLEGLVRRLST